MRGRKPIPVERNPRLWVTPTAAAELLGISTERVRQLRLAGALRGELMPNGRYQILRADVERRRSPISGYERVD